MNIPRQVLKIIETLENAGYEAYIVGGCVRDYILKKEPKDWDITTSALPEETKKLFPHTYDTGIQHGTITVVADKTNYEVTTYRIDGDYSDFRHPESVTFTEKIDEDLSRRDFTMNAIAYNETNGFCDPFNGRYDIANKLIKGVGDPDKRFNEDALRMLRGIRFSAQLNFAIEENTYLSIKRNSSLIKNISRERIRDEFTKLLLSPNPEKIIELKNTNLLCEILPVIDDKISEDCKIIRVLKNLSKTKSDDTALFYCAILADLTDKEATSVMKSLKFDTKTIKETATLVKYLKFEIEKNKYEIRKTISQIGVDLFKKLIIMRKATSEDETISKQIDNVENLFNEILEDNDCCSLKELKINGNILKSLGIKDGCLIGTILKSLLEKVLQEPKLNEENKLIELAKETQK